MSVTDIGEAEYLNWMLNGGAMATKTEIWLALARVTPPTDTAFTELTLTFSYGRVDVFNLFTVSGTATRGFNHTQIEFQASGGDWAEAIGFGLFNAETGGNPIWVGDLTDNRQIDDGEKLVFEVGDLGFTVS